MTCRRDTGWIGEEWIVALARADKERVVAGCRLEEAWLVGTGRHGMSRWSGTVRLAMGWVVERSRFAMSWVVAVACLVSGREVGTTREGKTRVVTEDGQGKPRLVASCGRVRSRVVGLARYGLVCAVVMARASRIRSRRTGRGSSSAAPRGPAFRRRSGSAPTGRARPGPRGWRR